MTLVILVKKKKKRLHSSQVYFIYQCKHGKWFRVHGSFWEKKKRSKPSAKVLKWSQVAHRHLKQFPGTLGCCQHREKYALQGEARREKGPENPWFQQIRKKNVNECAGQAPWASSPGCQPGGLGILGHWQLWCNSLTISHRERTQP